MANIVARQPDVKLALFSTVVDDFTAFGMDAAKAPPVEEREVGRQTTGLMVAAGIEDHRGRRHRAVEGRPTAPSWR